MANEGWFFRARRGLPVELREAQVAIEATARRYGLDFCDICFEMCDYDEINMIAAYGGFPTRYPHWRWGMDFLQMQKSYEYGLQKIYEMVINTVPSYAYLLDNNTFMDQKLVMAHVTGHVDFFTNNAWFAPTNRKMLDQMANHATRVRRHMDREGEDRVEQFIDICLSVENLIDPFSAHGPSHPPNFGPPVEGKIAAKPYMDGFINPPVAPPSPSPAPSVPTRPERDVLRFVLEHGQLLPWQQDILAIIREEALYFVPQAQTKIMNEGWASFWHTTLMTRELLEDSEVVDYADHHSGTVAMRPGQLNPYKLGIELFRHIEYRWDNGRFGKDWLDCDDLVARRDWHRPTALGRSKIFEVRRTHNDLTFIDTFLTEDFVREQGLFTTTFDKKANHWVVDSREFAAVKQRLLSMLSNRGNPRIEVLDANHANRGELVLQHQHEGADLQLDQAERTLRNLVQLWGRPVHLLTTVDGRTGRLSHDGQSFKSDTIRLPKQT